MPLVLTGVTLLGLPLTLFVLFKSNAAIMFLAACAGLVLLDSLDPTVVTTAASVIPGESEAYIRLAVVLLSIAFSALLMRGSVRKVVEYLLHGLLIIILSALLWARLPSLSAVPWLIDSTDQDVWGYIDDFKALIVAAGLSLSLLVVLRTKAHGGEKGKGKH